jgi:peroxiredoxin
MFCKYVRIFLPLSATIMLSGFSLINKSVSDFRLKNVNGEYVSLKDYPGAKGFIIVFTCNHCPFAKLYPPRLNALYNKYKPLGVPLIAISSTDTINYEEDTYSKMTEKAKNEQFAFPYLYDGQQTAAKNFSAQRTPHAFVIWNDNGNWIIKYDGAIDDNGAEPEKVKNQYIVKAVDALLNSQEVEVKETKSIGCQINFRK